MILNQESDVKIHAQTLSVRHRLQPTILIIRQFKIPRIGAVVFQR